MMARGAQQVLPLLARSLTTSSASALSAALATTKSSTVVTAGTRIETPLSEALPALKLPSAAPLAAAPELQSSTLTNGVRVAAIQNASPVTTVALFVPIGSVYETSETAGATKALELLAFKATANRTTFALTRELEKIGATPAVHVGREYTSFAISASKVNTAEAIELLLDSVLNAKLSFHEVRDLLDAAKAAAAAALADPHAVLAEVAHRAAFDGGLAHPLVADPSAFSALTVEKLRAYLSSRLTAGNLLLAAVGVSHAELLPIAQPLLDGVTAGGGVPAPPSLYAGGAVSVLNAGSAATHTLLAFEAPGGYSDLAAVAKAKVVAALLRDGLGAQSVLPHTRGSHEVLQSLQPFTALYQRTGLVGALASSTPGAAGAALDVLTKKVEALTQDVTDSALRQAKSAVVGEYKALGATSAGLVQIVGRGLMSGGKPNFNAAPSAVEALTVTDIKNYVLQLIKSKPTLATYGNLTSLPRYDTVVKRFK